MAVTLCRMGVGHFSLADPADFDPPDINRQFGAVESNMGKNKAHVYRDMLLDVNPQVEVSVFSSGLTGDNHEEFLAGADVLVDCLDASVAYSLREDMHRVAREESVFSCVAPILGFGCFSICSDPDGMDMSYWLDTIRQSKDNAKLPEYFFEYFENRHLKAIGESLKVGRVPTLAVGPLLGTSILATEVVAYLLESVVPDIRPPIVLPQVLFFDLHKKTYKTIDVRELRTKNA